MKTNIKILAENNKWLISELSRYRKKTYQAINRIVNKDPKKINISTKRKYHEALVNMWMINESDFTYLTLFEYEEQT